MTRGIAQVVKLLVNVPEDLGSIPITAKIENKNKFKKKENLCPPSNVPKSKVHKVDLFSRKQNYLLLRLGTQTYVG
jgi:hypothetical protein